jgi:hypothetical protein
MTPQLAQLPKVISKFQRLRAFIAQRFRVPLDLIWLVGWRDVFLAAGFGCVVRGVAIFSAALGWIVLGAGLIAFAFLMAEKPKPPVIKRVN